MAVEPGLLARIACWFERSLLWLIALSMVLGALIGFTWPGAAPELRRYIDFTLYLMLYPMMVGVQVEQVACAAKEIKPIAWSLFFNFIFSPLLGWLIALLLLRHHPEFAAGLVLLAATPCAGMVVGWTGLGRGNVPLALVIVVVSLLLSIVTIPATTYLLAGTFVRLDAVAIMKSTLTVILVPLVAGDLTRRLILARWGNAGFQAVCPALPPLSMLGMFGIIAISVANGAPQMAAHRTGTLLALPALALFYVLQLVATVNAAPRFGFRPGEIVALVNAVVGKNVPLALGLAVHFFGPVTAAMLAVNPLLQVPTMFWIYRWAVRLPMQKSGEVENTGAAGSAAEKENPDQKRSSGTGGKK
ncbi:arsenic resistance protein [Thermodesulfitimonas sp.]